MARETVTILAKSKKGSDPSSGSIGLFLRRFRVYIERCAPNWPAQRQRGRFTENIKIRIVEIRISEEERPVTDKFPTEDSREASRELSCIPLAKRNIDPPIPKKI